MSSKKRRMSRQERLQKLVGGDLMALDEAQIEDLAIFLMDEKSDAEVIDLLGRLKGFCHPQTRIRILRADVSLDGLVLSERLRFLIKTMQYRLHMRRMERIIH